MTDNNGSKKFYGKQAIQQVRQFFRLKAKDLSETQPELISQKGLLISKRDRQSNQAEEIKNKIKDAVKNTFLLDLETNHAMLAAELDNVVNSNLDQQNTTGTTDFKAQTLVRIEALNPSGRQSEGQDVSRTDRAYFN